MHKYTIHNVGDRYENSCYNSYLIKDEKTALVDVVCDNAADASIERICSLTSLKEIDYIIINHTMPDTTEVIKRILEENSDVKIVATIAAIRNLKEIMNISFGHIAARDAEKIELGEAVLKLIITPNLEWPDSMMTYLENEKTLFSSVAFGSYSVSVNRPISGEELYFENKLSMNIEFVKLALSRIENLDIAKIYPQIGDVTEDADGIFRLYRQRIKEKVFNKNKVAVIYESKFGANKALAEAAYDAVRIAGLESVLIDVEGMSKADIQKEIESSGAVMLGFPTINRNAPAGIWDIVTGMNIEAVKDKSFALFSSYGWSGEGVYNVQALLKAMRLNTEQKPYTVLFTPTKDNIVEMKRYTNDFIGKL